VVIGVGNEDEVAEGRLDGEKGMIEKWGNGDEEVVNEPAMIFPVEVPEIVGDVEPDGMGTFDWMIWDKDGATVTDLLAETDCTNGVTETGVAEGDTGNGEIDDVNEKTTGDRVAEGRKGLTEGEGGIAVTKVTRNPLLCTLLANTTKAIELVVVKTAAWDWPVKEPNNGEVVELPSKIYNTSPNERSKNSTVT